MWKKIKVREHVPLAPFTSLKIGGSARYFFVAKTKEELQDAVQEAREQHIPFFILGGGSDVLISDQGFSGLVIRSQILGMRVAGSCITVRSGERTASFLQECRKHGLSGLEFTAGVPASLGGVIWANFGAYGHEVQEYVESVLILNEENQFQTFARQECQFSYRESIFKHEPYSIVEATFSLQPASQDEIQKRILDIIRKRPKIFPSCGSVFRNPHGAKAGELIDQLGLKGTKIGGAQISPDHANYIVNTGHATAEDVVILVSLMKQKVRDTLGIELREEMQYVGF